MQTLPRQRTERRSLRPDPGCRHDLLSLYYIVLIDNLCLYFEFIANVSNFHVIITFTTSLTNVDSLTTLSLYSYGAIICLDWVTAVPTTQGVGSPVCHNPHHSLLCPSHYCQLFIVIYHNISAAGFLIIVRMKVKSFRIHVFITSGR